MIFCATDCTRFCLLHELLKLVVECVSSYLRLACAWPLTCYVYFCQARYSNFSLTWYRKARLRSKVGRCMICSRISEENFLISFFFFFHVPLLPSLQFFFLFQGERTELGAWLLSLAAWCQTCPLQKQLRELLASTTLIVYIQSRRCDMYFCLSKIVFRK